MQRLLIALILAGCASTAPPGQRAVVTVAPTIPVCERDADREKIIERLNARLAELEKTLQESDPACLNARWEEREAMLLMAFSAFDTPEVEEVAEREYQDAVAHRLATCKQKRPR